MPHKIIRWAASIAVVLALGVVMLGAYTRLTNAGLGCPDWPGCYGHMVLPSAQTQLIKAQEHYPNVPIESRKAWTEMAHRYAAGTLALLIFFIGGSVIYQRLKGQRLPWTLPALLMLLVLFQAALGMWTVTLKLLPIVVMGHLLGGILIFACLCRYRLQISSCATEAFVFARKDEIWIRLGVLIVLIQIALGGWVSSNYAGISCISLPTCNGMWWPKLHLADGFYLFSPIGANYQGGLLDHNARMTIQFIHRLGPVITLLYVALLSMLLLFRAQRPELKTAALFLMMLVAAQFTLGILNVLYQLPLSIAVAHNGGAALLLAMMVCLLPMTRKGRLERDH